MPSEQPHTREIQVGYTTPGHLPPYVNVARLVDGRVRLTVRSHPELYSDGEPRELGRVSVIYLGREEWSTFVSDLLAAGLG